MKNKIESADIKGAHKDNGATIFCPYCKTMQTIRMEANGMNKAFKTNCSSCDKVMKVDIPKLFKSIHFVASIQTAK